VLRKQYCDSLQQHGLWLTQMLQQLLGCTSLGFAFSYRMVPKGEGVQSLFEKTLLSVLRGYLSYRNEQPCHRLM